MNEYRTDDPSKKGVESLLRLEEEHQKYIELFNLSPVPQWVYDLDNLRFLNVNEAAIRHYGYSRAEFMQMSLLDIRPEEDISSLFDILSNEVTVGVFNKSTVRHLKKNGEIIHICAEGNSIAFEGKNARMVMIIDRTAEIRAREAMEESIERFKIVSKATSDAIWDLNIITGEIIWNKGISGIFGHKMNTSTETWRRGHIHPDDLEQVIHEVNSLIRSKKHRIKLQYRFRCANGTYKSVQDRAFLLFNESGQPLRMIGSMQDITAQVKHMEAIEEQNARLLEISWIQSHRIRSPLSKILGLVSLMNAEDADLSSMKELITHLKTSSEELDSAIKEIIKKTNPHKKPGL